MKFWKIKYAVVKIIAENKNINWQLPYEKETPHVGRGTGFFIDKRLFYPGDAFYNPGKPVGILALPVAGPWSRVRDFMKYVLEVKPKICFPVHDGMLDPNFGTCHRVPAAVLPKHGIEFRNFEENNEEEF